MALSRSELGTASRRAWLPSVSQVNRTGGSPASATTRSSTFRVSASATTEKTDITSAAGTPPWLMAITVGRSFADASTSSSIVPAREMARRRKNDELRSTARRSWSSMIPTTRPSADTTGKCRMPRSSMSTRTSLPERSLGTVKAGAVMTADTGESPDMPPATTLDRRSLSVTMPTDSPRSTTRAVAPASVRSRAASRTGVAGVQTTGADRMEALTGWRSWSRATVDPASDDSWWRSSRSERVR